MILINTHKKRKKIILKFLFKNKYINKIKK